MADNWTPTQYQQYKILKQQNQTKTPWGRPPVRGPVSPTTPSPVPPRLARPAPIRPGGPTPQPPPRRIPTPVLPVRPITTRPSGGR